MLLEYELIILQDKKYPREISEDFSDLVEEETRIWLPVLLTKPRFIMCNKNIEKGEGIKKLQRIRIL